MSTIEELQEALEIEREQHRLDIAALQEQLADAQEAQANSARAEHALDGLDLHGKDSVEDPQLYELQMLRDQVEELTEKLQQQEGGGEESDATAWLQMQLDQQTTRADSLEQECELLRQGVDSGGNSAELEAACDDLRKQLDYKAKEIELERTTHQKKIDEAQQHSASLQTRLEEAIKGSSPKVDELSRECAQLRKQIDETSQEHSAKVAEFERERSELQERLQEAAKKSAAQVEELQKECVQLKEQLKANTDGFEAERTALQKRVDEAAKQLEASSAGETNAMEALRREHSELQVRSQEEAKKSLAEAEELRRECAQLKEQLKSSADRFDAERAALQTKLDSLESKAAQTRQNDGDATRHAKEADELRTKCVSLEGQLESHMAKLVALERDNALLQTKLDESSKAQTEKSKSLAQDNNAAVIVGNEREVSKRDSGHLKSPVKATGMIDESNIEAVKELKSQMDELRQQVAEADLVEKDHIDQIQKLEKELQQLRQQMGTSFVDMMLGGFCAANRAP
eukprot:TRINITY_DN20926_c0_g1_i1.p1 TRINITY_DN20926_c0_g1~~TRINITY_DN20926_c0_g1_i1.p1  ORF type:complete len:517 (+),score=141.04 TRINITY_DN20926_c0_g1_i1:116-1666(+)